MNSRRKEKKYQLLKKTISLFLQVSSKEYSFNKIWMA